MAENTEARMPLRKFGNESTTVYHGDCLQLLYEVTDSSVDLVFADPPYNIGKRFGAFVDAWPSDRDYAQWCVQWLELCIAKLKPNGSLYVMTSTQAMPYLDLWLRERLSVVSRIVWHYDSSGVQAKKYFGSLYEPILFCVKNPKDYTFNAADIEIEARTGAVRKLIDYRRKTPTQYKTTKVPGNAWYIPRVRYRMAEYENHPSQKPEALLERIIRASTNEGDTVLDPFAGVFTSCAVAQRLGRRSIGIEPHGGRRRRGSCVACQWHVHEPMMRHLADEQHLEGVQRVGQGGLHFPLQRSAQRRRPPFHADAQTFDDARTFHDGPRLFAVIVYCYHSDHSNNKTHGQRVVGYFE
jgi:adenine-specific DNA-methyltransferase